MKLFERYVHDFLTIFKILLMRKNNLLCFSCWWSFSSSLKVFRKWFFIPLSKKFFMSVKNTFPPVSRWSCKKKKYKRKDLVEKSWKGALKYILSVFPFLIQEQSMTEMLIEDWGSVVYIWTEHYPHRFKTFRTVALIWMKNSLEKQ